MRDDRPEALDQSTAGDRPREDIGHPPVELSRRLESLPHGHPSSPYEADGAPRQPAVRLRDLDTTADDDASQGDANADDADASDASPSDFSAGDASPGDASRPADTRRFTDAEWADHVADVRARLEKARAEGLSTERQYAIDEDGEAWTPSRREIHWTIIEDLYDQSSSVPCDYKAIVAGGLAGAGKTTVLADHAGIDRSQYLTINPDDIKAEMAKCGLVPKIEGLSPMEASDLVHEESSHIAKQLAIRARAEGKNLIWDITMASRATTQRRIDDLRGSGYTAISGIFVDIPVGVSAARADARHRRDQDAYEAGEGLGGRYVPPEVSVGQADPHWGSQNRNTFEDLKPRFDQWTRFDNGVDDRDPVLIEASPHDDNLEETPS